MLIKLYDYNDMYRFDEFEAHLFTSSKPIVDYVADKITVAGKEYRFSTANWLPHDIAQYTHGKIDAHVNNAAIHAPLNDAANSNTACLLLEAVNQPTTYAHWLRFGTAGGGGILPFAPNVGAIGSDSSRWESVHATTMYENGSALSVKYAPKTHGHNLTEVSGLHCRNNKNRSNG